MSFILSTFYTSAKEHQQETEITQHKQLNTNIIMSASLSVAHASLWKGRLRTAHTLYELEEDETTIGRDANNDLILDSRGISRFH